MARTRPAPWRAQNMHKCDGPAEVEYGSCPSLLCLCPSRLLTRTHTCQIQLPQVPLRL